ncbi:MAG: N-6 DNA methylase, partial [Kiritimatiellia bacterium]
MLNRIAFDSAVGSGGVLARLKLVGELARVKAELKGANGALARLKLSARANQIRAELGAMQTATGGGAAEGEQPAAPDATAGDDAPPAPRNQTAQYYEFDPNRKPAQRKKDNTEAMALLRRIDAGEVDSARLTPEEKLALAKYSGTGGALIGADGKKGSAYEYYTPKPIAEGVWELMGELGFSGGKVLDPCAGVGVFGATAPLSAAIDAVELNETSGRINGLVNAGPGYTATVSPFEKVAAATPDEQYDAVVTNVPFGGVADRGGNQLLDSRYQKEPLQNYFILRSLEKLKPGGLAVFITPPRCVSGKGGKEEELRVKASYVAEFLGAYRLPNSVFGTASADTMTDVIAFRKYSRDTLDKIAELREQSPKVLIEANVQWQPFIDGRYFDGEGKRFVLGEFVPKDPTKFRDVDRVITKAPIGEIGRMLKRFPDSRVNWDMLGASETTPIIYRDGDTITQAGQTLQMQDGRWVPLARGEDSASMADLVGKMKDPYAAFEAGATWPDAEKCVDYMVETSQSLDIPDWLRGAMAEIRRLKAADQRAQFWNAGIVGMAAAQVLQERLGEETGVNFLAEYPALSDAMQRVAGVAKKRPSALGGKLRDGLLTIGNHYQKKTGFSAVWRGDVQQQAPSVESTADSTFEGLRYKTKSIWASLEDTRAIYGEGFDPHADPAWCLSPDGKSVTRADDYYVGNYAEFLARVDADIAGAASDDIRAKLLRQKMDAAARIDKVDVSKLTFNLFSPHVSLEEKADFLRRFVHPSAAVIYDERTGEKRVDIDVPGSNLTDREKLLNRIGDYLKNGTI